MRATCARNFRSLSLRPLHLLASRHSLPLPSLQPVSLFLNQTLTPLFLALPLSLPGDSYCLDCTSGTFSGFNGDENMCIQKVILCTLRVEMNAQICICLTWREEMILTASAFCTGSTACSRCKAGSFSSSLGQLKSSILILLALFCTIL